jgi:hypothetical protein
MLDTGVKFVNETVNGTSVISSAFNNTLGDSKQVVDFAQDLLNGLSNGMTGGEKAQDIISDGVRISANNANNDELSGKEIGAPLTDDERNGTGNSTKSTSFKLPPNGFKSCQASEFAKFGVSLWSVSPFGNITGSEGLSADMIQLQLGLADDSDPNIDPELSPYNVTTA